MKTLLKLGTLFVLLGATLALSYTPLSNWWRKRQLPQWQDAKVVCGRIISSVKSTGTVKPVMSVQVGAFVSGPIDPETPLVEFNREVNKGDVLAVIDQRIYDANVARDKAAKDAASARVDAAAAEQEAARATVSRETAALLTRQAEVARARAQLSQAQNDEARALALKQENGDFISQAEMDQLKFNRMSLEEQLNVARASVQQAEAAVTQAEAAVDQAKASTKQALASVQQAEANLLLSGLNLGYTVITSPVDGIVIDRKIQPGQTLASSFQTPELFVVAPRMREEIHVHASVDEADIGLIRDAQRRGNPVQFTVDAYPDDFFEGNIKEVRFNSTTTQNVVTYPVIVSATNPDLKLLPGMTASISFQVEEHVDVLKLPNAALRFYPRREHVRSEDHALLDGADQADEEESESADAFLSAEDQSEALRKRRRRHVWVVEDDKLRAVEVEVGISDNKFTEVLLGNVTEGMKLVTGAEPAKGWF